MIEQLKSCKDKDYIYYSQEISQVKWSQPNEKISNMILSREDNWQKHASLLKSAVYYENSTEYENYSKYLRQKYEKIERKFSIAHFYFRQMTVYQFERDERYSLIDCIGTTYIPNTHPCSSESVQKEIHFLKL